MSTMKRTANVYYGPDDTVYAKAGSVSSGETITAIWYEGTWAYIQYSVSGTRNKKRGYVPQKAVTVTESISTITTTSATRYVNTAHDVYTGPASTGYAEAGSVSLGEAVTYLGKKISNYAFIEYTVTSTGKKKRAYIYAKYLSTSPITTLTVYASKCSGSSTLTSAQMLANAHYICAYLQGQGFTKQAACGVLGNMYHESKVNPGIWEGGYLDNPRGGYGLVQWTSTTYSSNGVPSPFLVYAASQGIISSKTAATELDTLATNNPKKLMDAELDWLIKSMKPGQGYFFYSSSFNHSGYTAMTYSSFIASTLDAGTLATVFHDYYERSADSATAIAKNRSNPAKNYYNTGAFS